MLDILTRAKNAIEAYNTELRVSSANIANMSVNGYKKMNVSFQSVFENVLNGGTAASDNMGGTNPIQYGSGVGVSNVGIDFTQGTFTAGDQLSLAVNGTGLFIVSPDDGKTQLYTRTGKFHVDNAGNLVTDNGMQVYGYAGGSLTPITGLTNFNTSALGWTSDGQLAELTAETDASGNPVTDTSGNTVYTPTKYTGYTIALTSFTNRSGLLQSSGNAFAASEASGNALTPAAPGGNFGSIVPASLEQSNVFYTSEVIDEMEAQRAMSGNLTVLRMMSDQISSFISKIS
jgi:flagellar hook protein FlgE